MSRRLLQNQGQLKMFVAGTNQYFYGTGCAFTSPDGTTWTERDSDQNETSTTGNSWDGSCYSPNLRRIVMVKEGGNKQIVTSDDGVAWTSRTSPGGKYFGVCWSEDLSLFVACGGTYGSSADIMTSPDGIAWTSRTITASDRLNAIAWSSDLSLFVAVGYSGEVHTSPDGITWTSRTAASAITWNDVIWVDDLSLFVAVGQNVGGGGGAELVMTSPNGITWTSRTVPSVSFWLGIAYSPELSLLCANSMVDGFMTSPDGITWTARAQAEYSVMRDICWSPEKSMFLAVGSLGDYCVQYSSDGINWTAVAITRALWSVIWVP